MLHEKKNIYAIVVTYNGIRWIERCLESLLLLSEIKLNVIVVDNNSSDGTIDFIIEKYPEIELIPLKENVGFAAANNLAIEHVLGKYPDYLLLLNQDAWIEPNTIFELLSGFKFGSHFGIMCPIQLNGDNSALDFNFSMHLNRDNCPTFISDLYFNKLDKVYEIKFSNAACWLVDINCIYKVGLFDPIFKLYGEDDNYVQRLVFHSLRIGLVPSSTVFHDREYRLGKKTPSSLFYEEKVEVLKIILNVNHGLIRSLIAGFTYIFKSVFNKLISFDFGELLYDMKIIFFILLNFRLLFLRRKKYLSGLDII